MEQVSALEAPRAPQVHGARHFYVPKEMERSGEGSTADRGETDQREEEMGVCSTLEQGEVASDDGGIDDGIHGVGRPYDHGGFKRLWMD